MFVCLFGWLLGLLIAATENPFNSILKTLEKPGGGGEFGKYYSLPALNDLRIGESLFSIFTILFSSSYHR